MTLSTHVLDTARGCPAADVHVRLARRAAHGYVALAEARTDKDGRIGEWTPLGREWTGTLEAATYRLIFDTGGYLGDDAFFPEVTVVFTIADADQHHHVPLLLSPFGYSTYRGS